jgi:hypothetical protein
MLAMGSQLLRRELNRSPVAKGAKLKKLKKKVVVKTSHIQNFPSFDSTIFGETGLKPILPVRF